MSSLDSRIEKLEAAAATQTTGPHWAIPIVESWQFATQADLDAHLDELEKQALAKDWRLGHGPFVIVVQYDVV